MWSLLLTLTEIVFLIRLEKIISAFSVARDAIFSLVFCAKQFEVGGRVIWTAQTLQRYLRALFIIHLLL